MHDNFDKLDNKIREFSQDVPTLPSNFKDQVWTFIHSKEEQAGMWGLSDLLEDTFLASISPLRLVASSATIAVTISAILGIWIGSSNTQPKYKKSIFSMDSSSSELHLLGH